jgi:hypothetical protein
MQPGQLAIGVKRRQALVGALLFAVLTVAGVDRGIAANSVTAVLMAVLIPGSLFVLYAARGVRKRPVLVIADEALTLRGQAVPWTSIFEAHLRQRQGVFGKYHHLVLTVRKDDMPRHEQARGLQTSRVPAETTRLSLDQLTMPWHAILALVQERLGKEVRTSHEAGLFGKATV